MVTKVDAEARASEPGTSAHGHGHGHAHAHEHAHAPRVRGDGDGAEEVANVGDVGNVGDVSSKVELHRGMRWLAFALHLGRVCMWSAALAAVCVLVPEWPLVLGAAVPAALVYFAAFSLFHDCAHGALNLPPRVNDVVLMLTSIPLFLSAHGQRQLHLRHHARPLAPDDMEGEGALASLPMAVVTAPAASFRMRVASFFAANARVKPWIVVENGLNVAVLVFVVWFANEGLLVAAGTMFGLQLSMNAWASHVPHRAPRWLLALAAKLSWTHSPVVLSLVYHLEHHAHPRVPCMDLRPNLDVIHSPLIENAVVARAEPLPWVNLQVVTRPRPRTRV